MKTLKKIGKFFLSIIKDIADFLGFGSWRESKKTLSCYAAMIGLIVALGLIAYLSAWGLLFLHGLSGAPTFPLENYLLVVTLVPIGCLFLCGFIYSLWVSAIKRWKSLDN